MLGGGYIAADLGHFSGALGTRVTIIHRHALMLPRDDPDDSAAFTRLFGERHDVRLQAEATRVTEKRDRIAVEMRHAAGRREVLEARQLLVATGIMPNIDTLRLDVAGVAVDGRGFIAADPMLRTSVPDISALGDAVGRFAFKHSANHEARYLIRNLAHPDDLKEVNSHAMPHAIFSDPQVGAVGATEDELRMNATSYLVARASYEHTGMRSALMERDGFVKFLVEPETSRILGCHILGPEAATLIHEVLVGMTASTGTLDDNLETMHIHPALSEVVQRAAANVAVLAAHHPARASHS